MKCSLGISNFLEEISSLFHSIVFLCFFALITEEGFLTSPGYSLELCIQMGISLLFLLCLTLLIFSQLFVRPPQAAIFAFLPFFFLRRVLVTTSYTVLQTSIHNTQKYLDSCFPYAATTSWKARSSLITQCFPMPLWSQSIHPAVQFSCSVVSNSLRPYGLQHARFPCP